MKAKSLRYSFRSVNPLKTSFVALVAVVLATLGASLVLKAEEETSAPPVTSPTVGQNEARSSAGELSELDWGEDYQISIVGGDPLSRVRFSVFVNEYREDFRWLLYRLRVDRPGARMSRLAWSIPIKVSLWGTFQDVFKGEAFQTTVELRPDRRFVINLDVKLHDRFDELAFQRALAKVLLIEQIVAPYSRNPDAFILEEVKPPDWLVHGFDQLIQHRRAGSPSSYYRGFLSSGQILRPEELFAQSDPGALDPISFAIYRASSAALVEALLGQPDGDASLRGLLGDLGQPKLPSIEVLMRQHFPAFREMDQGLEKWWALELASLSQHQSFEYLNREETERLLTQALTVHFEATTVAVPVESEGKRGLRDLFKAKATVPAITQEPFHGTIDQYEQYLNRSGVKEQLVGSYDRIQSLKRVGFPLYRPVFTAYEQLLVRLSRGDTKEIAAEFEAVAELRTRIGETLIRTEDFLNHFEATRAPQRSNAFNDYIEMRRALEKRGRPQRHDAITRHLDALEWEFR